MGSEGEESMKQSAIDAMPELVSAEEFGQVLGLSGDQVATLCEAGALPAVMVAGSWKVRKAAALRRVRSVRGIDLSSLG